VCLGHVDTRRVTLSRALAQALAGVGPQWRLPKGHGLLVMTSCGHRAIVKSVRTAIKPSGVEKVHAIVGSFHLAWHAPEYQRQTLAELQTVKPDLPIPMHGSGESFISMVQQAMPDRFVRSSTGTRFTFSD
jgi:7,8-dihydropterin-6-yl-methyl-4-(beta-D-ribofuranosyl)aminobenzene 5'-phosphate synthase